MKTHRKHTMPVRTTLVPQSTNYVFKRISIRCEHSISKLMQSKDSNLVSVIKLLKNTKDCFENSCSDKYFTQVLEDAKALASEIDCEVLDFENVARPGARSKKKHLTYECVEPIIEHRQKYKIEVFSHYRYSHKFFIIKIFPDF